ncbi:MAG: hypothetical protein RBR65_05135 [Aliarcobacter sp.]|jgi:hypothetical protein|nr:hypothetical protein [Aliarcobacter sp.]
MNFTLNFKIENALRNEDISKVLNKILNKLDKIAVGDRANRLTLVINEGNFPSLYEPQEINDDIELENNINLLIKEKIFDLQQNKKSECLPLCDKKAKLIFNYDSENILRTFYNREIKVDDWADILENYFPKDSELYCLLKNNLFKIEGKSNNEIIEKLSIWINQDKKSNSQRQESARCFWGLSKIFDKRDEFNNYFALESMSITLLIHPKSNSIKDILFIENLDTFHSVIESTNSIFDDFVLIYSAGYKLGAKRIRNRNGSKMFFTDDCIFSKETKEEFISWFYFEKGMNINTFFWGDLDYSGIDILASLKTNFSNLRAWEEAYSKMLDALDFGHPPIMAKKENQREPRVTGCNYADNILLPALKEKKLFLDQEFIDFS